MNIWVYCSLLLASTFCQAVSAPFLQNISNIFNGNAIHIKRGDTVLRATGQTPCIVGFLLLQKSNYCTTLWSTWDKSGFWDNSLWGIACWQMHWSPVGHPHTPEGKISCSKKHKAAKQNPLETDCQRDKMYLVLMVLSVHGAWLLSMCFQKHKGKEVQWLGRGHLLRSDAKPAAPPSINNISFAEGDTKILINSNSSRT